MNVLQLFTTVDRQEVVDAHNEAYPEYILSREFYDHFIEVVANKVLIIDPNAFIDIDHIVTRHDDPVDDEDRFDVTLYTDQTYSMSFVPWGEILAMTVRDNSGELTLPQQAAHIFWEMTWHGMEEETIERGQEVLDRVDALERALEERDEIGDSAGLKSFSTVDDLMAPLDQGKSEEEIAERREQSRKHIANIRSARYFKNGVLQN